MLVIRARCAPGAGVSLRSPSVWKWLLKALGSGMWQTPALSRSAPAVPRCSRAGCSKGIWCWVVLGRVSPPCVGACSQGPVLEVARQQSELRH